VPLVVEIFGMEEVGGDLLCQSIHILRTGKIVIITGQKEDRHISDVFNPQLGDVLRAIVQFVEISVLLNVVELLESIPINYLAVVQQLFRRGGVLDISLHLVN